jgi:hypothetical protein
VAGAEMDRATGAAAPSVCSGGGEEGMDVSRWLLFRRDWIRPNLSPRAQGLNIFNQIV